MNDENTENRAPGAPGAEARGRTVACVFAHPDDETFAAGATLARYAADDVRIHLLCATDGDAGRSSDVAAASREELGRLRRAELRDAARVLGIRTVQALGLPDGELRSVDADELTCEIVRFLRMHRPDVVLTFGPEGAPNAHRDHRVISRLATAAYFLAGLPSAWPRQLSGPGALGVHRASRLYYASWEPPPPGAAIPHAVPLTARLAARPWEQAKRRAFDAHRTQHVHRDTFEEIAMTDDECFALAAGVAQPRAIVEDLFEGL